MGEGGGGEGGKLGGVVAVPIPHPLRLRRPRPPATGRVGGGGDTPLPNHIYPVNFLRPKKTLLPFSKVKITTNKSANSNTSLIGSAPSREGLDFMAK